MKKSTENEFPELNSATRQFRHNNDNSPSLSNPEQGFVIAYDREETEKVIRELRAELDQLKQERGEICDVLGIGSGSRTRPTILANIENDRRRSDCLSLIESRYFTITEKDEDGEEMEECLLSWGDDPEQYASQFGEVLKQGRGEPVAWAVYVKFDNGEMRPTDPGPYHDKRLAEWEAAKCDGGVVVPLCPPAPAAVPEGYALVPITPSPEQLKAMVGWRELDEDERLPLGSEVEMFSRVYTCGVRAATPQPNTEPSRHSPWTDYAGNTINEGDRIGHPSGQKGRVYYTQAEDEIDAWRVDYDDGADSPLALQIGDKGRAVVLE